MSSHNNPDVTDDPTETGVKHGVYPGMYLTKRGLAGVMRRIKRRGQTITDEPLLRTATATTFNRAAPKPVVTRTCPRCGDAFTVTTSNKRYCDAECQIAAANQRAYAKRKGAA